MRKKCNIDSVNSGGSFHLGGHRGKILHEGRHQHMVFKYVLESNQRDEKHHRAIEQFKDEHLHDGDMCHSTIYGIYNPMQEIGHSLNKRKRWLLVDEVCKAIDELQNDPEAPVRLTCIEREVDPLLKGDMCRYSKRILSSDCTGYHDSKMKQSSVYPTNHTYARFTALRNTEKLKRGAGVDHGKLNKKQRQKIARRSLHFRNGRSEQRRVHLNVDKLNHKQVESLNFDLVEPESEPEIRYEVTHPMPVCPHRFLRTDHEARMLQKYGPLMKTTQLHKQAKLIDDCDLEQRIIQDVEEDFYNAALQYSLEDDAQNSSRTSSVSLLDAVIHKKPKVKRKRRKCGKKDDDELKPKRIIYEEPNIKLLDNNDDDMFLHATGSDISEWSEIPDPKTVHLEIKEGNLRSLKTYHGEAFVEGKSNPKVCSLLMGGNVHMTWKESDETDWEMVKDEDVVTIVAIRITGSLGHDEMERVFDVIERQKDSMKSMNQVVHAIRQASSSSYQGGRKVKRASSGLLGKIFNPCKQVQILSHSEAQRIAVVEHYAKLENNIFKQAYQCESFIDLASLLWHLPSEHHQQLMDNITATRVSSDPSWNRCPNPKCQRYARVLDTERPSVLNIECECGLKWCFYCKERIHWPASCRHNKYYIDHLKRLGLYNKTGYHQDTVVNVSVKRCPKCQYPIQKNGGCPHMICSMCQVSFCWLCSKRFNNHPIRCTTVSPEVIELLVFPFGGLHGKWLELAVQHRTSKEYLGLIKSTARIAKMQKSLDVEKLTCMFSRDNSVIKLKNRKIAKSRNVLSCRELVDSLLKSVAFIQEIQHCLEFSCVMAGIVSNRAITIRLKKSIEQMTSTLQHIHEILGNVDQSNFEAISDRLPFLLSSTIKQLEKLQRIATCVNDGPY
ncbi:hypothetical protein CAPTEDRAFT_216609 [Capitella teleta]|uniref:RBR-type E3 ubiquitin transferase n=1 Tax=Capitella teleta TaxID=283909 RepID=R7U777_CAPTE|nr:hypothetical protein CAPTEDRAFT_216609 [Capitella teleta]|eukprot:ELU01971.1 hypothetical protein CAPTEDRAFT_216609 [Capitella teleta]